MKRVTVTCIWEPQHEIEVEDDWEVPATLGEFPPEALDEMTSNTASLVDWH